jgi:hypothetical protein
MTMAAGRLITCGLVIDVMLLRARSAAREAADAARALYI